MKKMMLALLLLMLVAAGLPWFNGIMAEKAAIQAVTAVNQANAAQGSDVRIEILAYERGVAHTRAAWRISLGSLSQAYGVKEVLFRETATHGMLGITSQTSLEQNSWFKKLVASLAGDQGPWFSDWAESPLAIVTRYPVFGPISCHVTLDQLVFNDRKGPLTIGALDWTIEVAKDLNRVRSKGRWDGLTQDADNGLGQVAFGSDQQKVGEMIWQGTGMVTLGSVKANQGLQAVSAENLTARFHLDAKAGEPEMALGMDITLDRLQTQGQVLSDGALSWQINHLDLKACQELMALYTQWVRDAMGARPGSAFPGGPGLAAQSRAQWMAGLEKLLKKDLEFRIPTLQAMLTQGEVRGRFALGLKKDMTLNHFYGLLTDPSGVLELFSLESELTMPAGLGSPELTRPMVPGMASGIFVMDGDRLIHRAEIRENALFLNDRKLDLRL